MKQALVSGGVATLVVLVAFALERYLTHDAAAGSSPVAAPGSTAPPIVADSMPRVHSLTVTVEPAEASWVDGARSTGADDRMLSDAANSVCFLTTVELGGFQGPDDTAACRVTVDDFTGFWKVTADVPEGSRSEIRCNARCLVWDEE